MEMNLGFPAFKEAMRWALRPDRSLVSALEYNRHVISELQFSIIEMILILVIIVIFITTTVTTSQHYFKD